MSHVKELFKESVMYEKLIDQLAKTLRGNIAQVEFYSIAFQLLAWVRASKLGRLTDDLSFNPAEAPRDVKYLSSIFTKIASMEALGNDSYAFSYVSPSLQYLSPGQLLQALEILSSSNLDQPWDPESLAMTMSSMGGRHLSALSFEVIRLMSQLAQVPESGKVYIPFEESFQLTATMQKRGATTFSETKMVWPFPWLINILSDTFANIHVGDSLERPGFLADSRLTQFDISIGFVPFGLKYDYSLVESDLFGRFPEHSRSSVVLSLRHILARTEKRAVIAVPNGLLFSPGSERSLRNDLLNQNLIDAVIALPPALLTNTSLPFSLLILNRERTSEHIVFVDANREHLFKRDGRGRTTLTGWECIADALSSNQDESFTCSIPVRVVLENESQLQPTRYCQRPEEKIAENLLKKHQSRALSELVTILRPIATFNSKGSEAVMEFGPAEFPEFGYVYKPSKEVYLTQTDLRKGSKQFLRPFDIIMSIKGSIGKAAIFPPVIDVGEKADYIAGQSCLILRVNDPVLIDPRVLFSFLKSEFGQIQLRKIISGASVPIIQLRDLEKIRIPIPVQIEQKKIIEKFEKIVQIEQKIVNLRNEQCEIHNNMYPTEE